MADLNTYDNPKNQAQRVFRKFGGVPNLFDAFKRARRPRALTTIYRWDTPIKRGGTGGLIPHSAMPDVLYVARREGVLLTDEDLSPMVTP